MGNRRVIYSLFVAALIVTATPGTLSAVQPIQALTVPWVPSSPTTPHYSWKGKQITLKGTTNVQDTGGNNIRYDWDPGDGGAHCAGVVTNQYDVECVYTYNLANATVGNTFNAILTVYDSTTSNGGTPPVYSNSASASYYTQIYAVPPNLPVETNAAIDGGLWYLHKYMHRYTGVSLTGVTVTNGGSGYESDGTTPPNVTFTGCTTSPSATAHVTGGVITSITLNSTGTGCASPVNVTITDPLNGNITTLTLTNPGHDYALRYNGTGTPGAGDGYYQDVIVGFSGSGGTGSGAFASANADTNPASGTYGHILTLSGGGGTGYVNPVTVTFTDGYCNPYKSAPYIVQACGAGAAATATATTGGTGAAATAVLSAATNFGDWSVCSGNASACGVPPSGITGVNCNAFEVSGHLEAGPAGDPYTEDVQRCLASTFNYLETSAISMKTNTFGAYNPDQNGNHIGVRTTDSNELYQNGMLMDAIVASGTPGKAVTAGALASLSHPGGGPYTYQDAIFDMVDYYAYCQDDAGSGTGGTTTEGGWRYSCNGDQDNSVSQWAGIGIIPARRTFNSSIPANTLSASKAWLTYSQAPGFGGNGFFGYGNSAPIWGPFADTPSGMVQLAMIGTGRSPTGAASPTQWDYAETFMRDHFDTPQTNNATLDVKDYYYGMFSFTKSMLLHDASGNGLGSSPIQFLQSLDNPGTYPQIDWYAAQDATFGGTDTSNGVARTLISGTPANNIKGQNADGSWFGHYYTGAQGYFETAWAVIMLNHTVFQQVPVACATANPNPAPNNSSVQLNGQCSNTPNPNRQIVSWQWDVSGTAGTNFTLSGVKVNNTFTKPVGPAFPYNFPVRLRVTDNSTPALTADFVFNVTLNVPNGVQPPTANAGGPYNFCPNTNQAGQPVYVPWYLNGSLSTQAAPDTITQYNWDYSCSGAFNSSHVAQPRVDTGANNFFNHNATPFNVCLMVVNNDNLSSVASASVTVHDPNDAQCSHCVASLSGKAKNFTPGSPGNAQLYWTDTNSVAFPIDHYNVYRSSTANFSSFVQVAGANGAYPAIKAPANPSGATLNFIDGSITKAATYYYRIAPATLNDTETCNSNLTLQVIVGGR